MPVFPIELPPAASGKGSAEVTLARNVGLLSGIADPEGGLSWVAEFTQLTLKDLGRGAPVNGPESRIPTPPPTSLTASTMNSYEPDTKAAAMLVGANRLLADFSRALVDVLTTIDDVNRMDGEPPLEPAVLLACWAAGVLGGYRSAPLVFVNALKARAIQRVLLDGVIVEVPSDLERAAAEYGSKEAILRDGPRSPAKFSPIDDTLEIAKERWLRPDLSPDVISLADSVATALGRLLVRIGGPSEGQPAIVWAYEPRPGRRAIDVCLQPLRFITAFVGEQPGANLPRPLPDGVRVVPVLPSIDIVRALEPATARLLIGVYTVVYRWLREATVYGEESAAGVSALDGLTALAAMADELLEADDPVKLDAAVAAATGAVRAAVRGQGGIPIGRLLSELDVVRDRIQTSPDDAGHLLDVLARGAVGLNRARSGARSRVDAPHLERTIHECWRVYNAVLNSRIQLAPGPSAAGFHLHNYAGFLGSLEDSASLRTAVDMFRRYVVPSRRAAFGSSPRGNTLRLAFQVAARSAGKLAESPGVPEAEARSASELASAWAWDAVATDSAREILESDREPTEGNVLFASAVLRAIEAAALRGGAVAPPPGCDVGGDWLEVLERMVQLSHAWIDAGARSPERVAADAELDGRLATIRAAAHA